MLRDNRGEEEDFWSCWNRTAVQPVAILLRFVTDSKNISSTDSKNISSTDSKNISSTDSKNISSTDANKLNDSP